MTRPKGTDPCLASNSETGSLAISSASRTIGLEADALAQLADAVAGTSLGAAIAATVDVIVSGQRRIVVTGMGKSGLVARKIAATFASTGTPSFFVHPAEAGHGDLGMIMKDDVVMAFSWSGETQELSDIVNFCGRSAVLLIAVTSRAHSSLGRHADIVLPLPQVEEACPNDLAPTCSTITQSALGDAIAVALIERRSFSSDDFRAFHPKGQLATRLLTMRELMTSGDGVPAVLGSAPVADAMIEMSAKRFGITAVVDDNGRLIGAFSDGDLRRSLTRGAIDGRVFDHMNNAPFYVAPDILASQAIAMMNARSITQAFVCIDDRPVGIVHLHELLRANVA